MHDHDKIRRLSKYEARDEVLFSLDGVADMEFLSPFGPLIGRTHVPQHLMDHLNDHVDRILAKTESGRHESLLSPEFCVSGGDDSINHWMSEQIANYVNGVEQSGSVQVQIERFWVVSQNAGTPSPVHFHSGDISGVMYLKVPSVNEEQHRENYISGRQAGYINFIIGGKQRLSRSIISFRPVIGQLLIFPAWLLHGAEPFAGTGERRSVAFNANIHD